MSILTLSVVSVTPNPVTRGNVLTITGNNLNRVAVVVFGSSNPGVLPSSWSNRASYASFVVDNNPTGGTPSEPGVACTGFLTRTQTQISFVVPEVMGSGQLTLLGPDRKFTTSQNVTVNG